MSVYGNWRAYSEPLDNGHEDLPGVVVLLDMASNDFLRLANWSIQRPTSQRIFRKHSVDGGSLKLALNKKSFGCCLITTSFQKMTVSVGSATKLKFIGSAQTNLRAEAPKAPMEHKYISFILHIYISSFFVF